MCSLAPDTPAENCAQSALSELSRKPVESIRYTASAIWRPERTFAAAHQVGQKPGEHCARPLCIGIGERRARNLAGAKMIKLAGVALKAGLDRSQALAAHQLRVQQCDELVLRRQPAHLLVGRKLVHKPIQHMPGHKLQDRVKYCIVVAHGVGSLSCLDRRQNVKTQKNPCHAPRPLKSNRTAVGLSRPSTSFARTIVRRGCPRQARA